MLLVQQISHLKKILTFDTLLFYVADIVQAVHVKRFKFLYMFVVGCSYKSVCKIQDFYSLILVFKICIHPTNNGKAFQKCRLKYPDIDCIIMITLKAYSTPRVFK